MTEVPKCSPRTPFFYSYYYCSLVTPVSETKTYLGFGMAHFHTEATACGKTARVNLTNLVPQVSVWMSRFVIAFGDPLLRVLCIWMGYGQSVDDLHLYDPECWSSMQITQIFFFHLEFVCVLLNGAISGISGRERTLQTTSKQNSVSAPLKLVSFWFNLWKSQ